MGHHPFKTVKYFFNKANLLSSLGRTYIILIPKVNSPKDVVDYKPISLCNVRYKIIFQIISNRLKTVIHHLIRPKLAGFLAGRSSLDNIITIQEVVHSLEMDIHIHPRMMIKKDVEKAYDVLEWNSNSCQLE